MFGPVNAAKFHTCCRALCTLLAYGPKLLAGCAQRNQAAFRNHLHPSVLEKYLPLSEPLFYDAVRELVHLHPKVRCHVR